jgi:hypothetical protein
MRAQCTSPPAYGLEDNIVEISLNYQQYTDDNEIFYYYRAALLIDLLPREGPLTGGNTVTAIGSNFYDTGNLTCKFGTVIVNATFKSSTELLCPAPAHTTPEYVPFSVSMGLDEYSNAL